MTDASPIKTLPFNEKGRYCEYQTAKWLSELDGVNLNLWFGVNYLDAVGEIDQLGMMATRLS